MNLRCGLCLGFVAISALATALTAHAADVDTWPVWADAEPLQLAAAVDRVGDDAVLSRLAAAGSVATRLAAVRGSEFLQSPELALPLLAELAGSRDSELAEPAARRAFLIAQRLQREGLSRREILRGDLQPARAALLRVAAQSRPRADIRLWLEQAAQLLAASGVP